MIQWHEQNGYKVEYATDSDVDTSADLLTKYRTAIIAGHDEYWTKGMRDHYERAVKRGVNLAVFGANTGYWQIRVETEKKEHKQIMICYKLDYIFDPAIKKNKFLTTTNWRDVLVDRPESNLLGSMYDPWGQPETLARTDTYPFNVVMDDHWVFANTGLHNGDQIPDVYSDETDRRMPQYPNSLPVQVLGSTTFMSSLGQHAIAESTIYQAKSGALVFNAGTLGWIWVLNDLKNPANSSPALGQMTRNILNRMSGL